MSYTSRSVEKYSNCRALFNKLAQDFKAKYNTEYAENKDVCALRITFNHDSGKPLSFYYIYGNPTIVVVLDEDVRLITANNTDASFVHIIDVIEEWDKRNKLL